MRKKTAIQRAATDVGLDTSLQDLLDDVEGELLVIDSEYRVRFANSPARSKLQKGPESPIGRLCYQVFQDRDKPCGAPLWDCPLRKVIESGSMTTLIHPNLSLVPTNILKLLPILSGIAMATPRQ